MEVTFYGTRGSVPVAGPDKVRYGGNTTCLQVKSSCLPPSMRLIIDAGSGIVPLSDEVVRESGVNEVTLLFTHYHHDHTQGLLLSSLLFVKSIKVMMYGPMEDGMSPGKMVQAIMNGPLFPVPYEEVASHLHAKGIEVPGSKVLVIHPQGGCKLFPLDELQRAEARGSSQLAFSSGRFSLNECLVIRMYRSNHPERTISYRFEERPTGAVFVFLTDHENTPELPNRLRDHLWDATLLVMDAQYTEQKYKKFCAGFGHGTPEYCVEIAHLVNAKQLGLTHHDPRSKDEDVDGILADAHTAAQKWRYRGQVFACADYQTVTLG